MQIFYERISILLEEAKDKNPKIKCRDFANMCGVRNTQMRNWLNYAGTPSAKTLRIIAEHLNINVAWLIGLSEYRYTSTDSLSIFCKNIPAQELEEVKKYIAFLKYKRECPQKKA